jgi:hypothetical protein
MKTNLPLRYLLLGFFVPCTAFAGTSEPAVAPTLQSASTESWWNASLNVGYETLHVYRGVDSSFGNANIWESLDVDIANFFHFTLYNGNSLNGEYWELTPSFYFYKDLGPVTAAAGMIWYHFPGEDGLDSEEYYIQLSRELGAGFSASAWFSYNARSEGWYHELKLNHSLPINDTVSVESHAALGYSSNYRGGENGLDNLTIGVGVPIKLSQSLTLKPALGYAFALDTLDTGDEGWAALTLSYRF